MTQQEIYKNMTKGEWKPELIRATQNKPVYWSIKAAKAGSSTWCAINVYGADKRFLKIAEAEANAITSAVNNTYGKGLNPEYYSDIVGALEEANEYIKSIARDPSYQQFGIVSLLNAKLNPKP